jgi:dienelactone hydrolase
MKNSLCAVNLGWRILSGVIISGALSGAVLARHPAPGAEDELIVRARAFVTALSRDDFQAAAKDFDETMLKASGPEKLAEFWKQVPERLGAFKKMGAARRAKLGAYDIVLITCEFEKTTLDIRVVFDEDKKIAGFQFVPMAPPVNYAAPKYADPSKFEEREVTVGSGQWKLPGTLTLPKGKGPFPAVVLVHGSGPNDRDEAIGPNKPFKDIAWGLATLGIAVLRYDKLTYVYGPKLVAHPKLAAALTVKQETIDGALDAVRLLKSIPEINKKDIFVLGHSLGGMLIPRIAVAGRDLDIAGFIIMAGLTEPLPETFLRQIVYISGLSGPLNEEQKKQIAEVKAQVAKINALTKADAGSAEKLLGASPSYWLDLKGYYPPAVAEKIKKPMLILQGGRDYQVTTQDFDNWKKALGGRRNVEFKLYPKLNHLFFEGQGMATPNEYMTTHGSVAEYVINDIAAFIRKASQTPFEYFRNNWTVVGLKDYERGTRVTPDTQLLLAGRDRVTIFCGDSLAPLGREPAKTLEEGWLPVVLVSAVDASVRYDFAIWATPLPSVPDWQKAYDGPAAGENFLTWIAVRASNESSANARARVRLRRWTASDDYAKVAETPHESAGAPHPEPPLDRDFAWTLGPGESRESAVNFPFFRTAGPPKFLKEDPALWRRRTVDYWKGLVARAARISVPCQKATQSLLASHVCQLIALDHGELHGGEGFYDAFYIRDGAYQVMELEEAGLTAVARRALDSYLAHQRPDGRFESQAGQFDANGQAVWALWQYYKITGDRSWLEAVYPKIRRAVDWTMEARSKTKSDASFPGLLPAAPADGEYLWDGKEHIVGYDLWNLRAMICALDAARELGKSADATGLSAEIADYGKAIDAAWRRTGLPYLPPSWEKLGTHWGNTEILWPVPVIDPADPRIAAQSVCVRKEHLGGYVEGTIRWGTPDMKRPAIHPYMGAYTTMNALHRGEDEQVVEDFSWYLLHSTAAQGFPEGIYYLDRTAWGETIPHVTGAANFALLLRHMLIHEAGGELHLLSAVPDWWLEDGKEIRIERAPTHFGEVSLVVRGTSSGVEVEWRGPTRRKPRAVILHLPETRRLAGKISGVKVVYRPAQSKRWDFAMVVGLYEKTAPPPFLVGVRVAFHDAEEIPFRVLAGREVTDGRNRHFRLNDLTACGLDFLSEIVNRRHGDRVDDRLGVVRPRRQRAVDPRLGRLARRDKPVIHRPLGALPLVDFPAKDPGIKFDRSLGIIDPDFEVNDSGHRNLLSLM